MRHSEVQVALHVRVLNAETAESVENSGAALSAWPLEWTLIGARELTRGPSLRIDSSFPRMCRCQCRHSIHALYLALYPIEKQHRHSADKRAVIHEA
jgi:hypothetical protein